MDRPSANDDAPDEAGLVRRAQSGDQAAFGDLVRAHHAAIFRLVLSMVRNEADAREIAQDVWVIAWRKLDRFRGEAKFSTWLHPIAVRRAIDHLRRRRRWFDRFIPFRSEVDETVAEAAPEPVAVESDPREGLLRDERLRRFERALAALPPKLRAVLALREVEGLSYEEIARAVDIRPGTVMSRLHHARRLLAQKLRDLPCD